MGKIIFDNKTVFESGKYYVFEGEKLAFCLSDAKRLTDNVYISLSAFNYGYLDTAILLKDLKDTVLDFSGATLYLKGRIQPFIIENCENLTIKNVNVEYDRSFYTELEVLGNNGDELYVKETEKFPVKSENGYMIPYSDTWENRNLHIGDMFIQAFDNETRNGVGIDVIVIGEEVKRHESPPCEVHQVKVKEENGIITMSGIKPWGNGKLWEKGTSIVLTHEYRDKSSCFIICSKNVTLKNYRIINGAGMGILSMYTENLTIDGLRLTRDEKSHGIITNAADAMHLISSKGKLIIKNSQVEGMVDDALNIHNNFYQAEEINANKLKVFRTAQSNMVNEYYKNFGIGDTVAVYKGSTLELKAEAVIKNIEILDRCYAVWELDKELADVEKGDIIENLSTQPQVLVENCSFGKSNTHLRIQTRGKTVIRNCVTELPIMFTGDTTYWFEASPVRDVCLENNKFIGKKAHISACPEYSASDKAPYYHSGIKVINNTFDSEMPLFARYTKDIEFVNNIQNGGKEFRFDLEHTENFTVKEK
ncbi:MAG: hypothetical protein E7564_09175 [Ruminococcaceae bacterium]|nr:hypothetical protein [Oscillospiraceae bacterium]